MKRKTHKTDWAVLRRVAERSPKSFALRIRRRNVGLLRALEKHNWVFSSHVGCPHCVDCETCLWIEAMKAVKNVNDGCCGVRFGGLPLRRIHMIAYDSTSEKVYSPNTLPGDLFLRYFNDAVRFVKAHIAWTKKPYWGRKVKHT